MHHQAHHNLKWLRSANVHIFSSWPAEGAIILCMSYKTKCATIIFIGDWEDISIAHVIINIKSEVFTFPIVIIFFCGCVSEMSVTSYSVTYCIYIPGKPGICFHYYCAVYDECKLSDTVHFGLKIVFVYLYITPSHYHHCANLSEDIELINACQLSFVECMCE